jgi:hypothetical protein
MNDFEFSVLEYLGKLENGVLAIISIKYKKSFYEGTFFYTDKDVVFTISEELQSIVGNIKDHPNYYEYIKKLLRIVVPFNEIYNSIDPVNFGGWLSKIADMKDLETPMVIDESETKPEPGLK